MKAEIHPDYAAIKVICSCGNEFTTRSTLGQDLHVEVCSSCHPFFTGKQKIVDSGGRVDKFRKRYNKAAATQLDARRRAPIWAHGGQNAAGASSASTAEREARRIGLPSIGLKGEWLEPRSGNTITCSSSSSTTSS